MSDTVVKIYDTTTVVQAVEQQTVVKFPVSLPGPQGPIGPAGGSAVSYVAGENLSSGRAVIIHSDLAYYFQPNNAAHHGRMAGITKTSAVNGQTVVIQHLGVLTDAAFTFSPNIPLWVSSNGEITDSYPASTVIQKAGMSLNNDKILIDFSVSIKQ